MQAPVPDEKRCFVLRAQKIWPTLRIVSAQCVHRAVNVLHTPTFDGAGWRRAASAALPANQKEGHVRSDANVVCMLVSYRHCRPQQIVSRGKLVTCLLFLNQRWYPVAGVECVGVRDLKSLTGWDATDQCLISTTPPCLAPACLCSGAQIHADRHPSAILSPLDGFALGCIGRSCRYLANIAADLDSSLQSQLSTVRFG